MAEGDVLSQLNSNHRNDSSTENIVENGFQEEPDFSDPEDYDDDVSDSELLEDKLRLKPKESDDLRNVIVVDRIPQVGPDRLEKLKTVLTKLFGKFGKVLNVHYPLDDNNVTKGYMFIEFENPDQAIEAVRVTDGHRLDKQHVFAVNLFTDIEKYSRIADEWETPQPQPYVDRGNLSYWLLEQDCLDQYSVVYDGGQVTAVYSNSYPEPTLLKQRSLWTETVVQWSCQGTYLATFHNKGIALWAGANFDQFNRFAHEGVSLIDFSPCEKYLITFSPKLARVDDPQAVIIWDVRTGIKKRCFHSDQQITWPLYKWSPDGKYFARSGPDVLSIYEVPTMMLLDKKSIKIPGIRNFSWSPTQNIIAYWVAEDKDVPARVTLMNIPSKKELRAKNLFNVADCRMHWQKSGEYLCVKVDRYTKAKKEKNENKYSGLYYNFEVFHMKEKQIPVDSLEIKEPIVAFSWEPVGNKFAIIHGEGPQLFSLSFYGIKPGGTIMLLKKFENKTFNHLFWSPAGQFIVAAGLRNLNHTLEFIDTSDFTITNTSEHFYLTDVEWDPTGRYVVSGVSYWAHTVDNSYWLWSFTGRIIRKHTLDKFCQLIWRPRPRSLLSEEKIKEIKRNLKKYSTQFEVKDQQASFKASKEISEKRKALIEAFIQYRQKREQEFLKTKSKRRELRASENQYEEEEEDDDEECDTFEYFVKEDIELIEDDED